MQQVIITSSRGSLYSARAVNSISYKLTLLFELIFGFGTIAVLWLFVLTRLGVWIWILYGTVLFIVFFSALTRFPRYFDVYADRLEIICFLRRYTIPMQGIRSAEHISSMNCQYGRHFISTWPCSEGVRLNLNYSWNCRSFVVMTPENPREFCMQLQNLITSGLQTTTVIQVTQPGMTFSPQPGMVYAQQPGVQFELSSYPQPGVVYGQQPQPNVVYGQQPQPSAVYGQQPQSGVVYGQQPQPNVIYGQQPQPVTYDQLQPGVVYGQQPQVVNPNTSQV